MEGAVIRPAGAEDAAGINGVYNLYIRESAATFEVADHTENDRRRWIETHLTDPRHPVFVAACRDGRICGFVNASPFDPRHAYETSVKVSVFVEAACHGQGVARRLYTVLFEVLSGQDVHRAYGLIVSPNPASVALHEAFGFAHVATLSEVGRKFGRYHDVMWYEKKLS